MRSVPAVRRPTRGALHVACSRFGVALPAGNRGRRAVVRSRAMAEKRIDDLREILSRAAARDEDLQRGLQTIAGELFEELGCDDKSPVWAEIEATEREHRV